MHRDTLNALLNLSDPFCISDVESIFKSRSKAELLIDHLASNRVVIEEAHYVATVWITCAGGAELGCWRLRCTKPLDINLLYGEKAAVASSFEEFVRSRRDGSLVGVLTLSGDEVVLGPIRTKEEAVAPTVTALSETCIPASQMLPGFRRIAPVAMAELQRCIDSEAWYSLTARGMSFKLSWQEKATPYSVETVEMHMPTPGPRLSFWQARVENAVVCSGVDENRQRAEAIAIGEAFERYALTRGPSDRHDDSAEPMEDCSGILFDYFRALDNSNRGGPRVRVQSVYDCQKTYSLPSSWVLFHGKPSIANSNGTAFAADRETAIESAICEVIERHHFMSCWLRRSDAEPIDELALSQELTARYLPEKRVDLAWYLLGTHFKLVSVLCVASSPIAPYLSLGAACRGTLKHAMSKALTEALTTRTLWTSQIAKIGRTEFCKTGDRYRNDTNPVSLGLIEMGHLWAADPNAPDKIAGFLTTGAGRAATITTLDKFFYCDITPPAISQKVVKVIHPDALPLPSCHAHLLALGRLVGEDNPMPLPFA